MILITGGRLIDPKSGTDDFLDIALEGGRIARIGKALPRTDCQVIDARGLIVVPGLVDVHVHFRDPGLTYKEDIQSGAAAAAHGGFTAVVCMANTKPPVDNAETLGEVLAKAARAKIRVYTVAAVSRGMEGRELTDMGALKKLGALGFSDDGFPIKDPAFLQKALLAVRELDVPISLHEEEGALIGLPGINEGKVSAALGLSGAPGVSESSIIARDCMIALATGARVHIQHVSAAESLDLIRLAKELGARRFPGSPPRISAELTPQHFSLTEDAVLAQGTLAKLNPPLRTEHDRQALIGGLKDGTIDMIATDHAPHSTEEKSRPFAEAPSGLIGLETALALGITKLVLPGHLSLLELIGKMTEAPAKLYGLEAGFLAEGGPADLTLFDDKETWTVSGFASKSSNSPFIGQPLTGKVKYTICRGKLVYQDGEV
ncbi:dihydroorotase (DHOase) [Treponema primitia ZAS-2]|uniref:Dihydroorotase n=1 Tax=Treponema primitia (strain ATCC BAA-887 / DSM 12427 / ZAS-2) TaxID=545694 RepID=F5YIX3_TREPZ|nr:dihydroorotase [Treponema primitia]AEF85401.1 dihydroorotase (DHOase) [Treponema primitia ZAS-2]